MAAVPSIGRASAVEPRPAPGAEAQATSLLYERYSRQIFNFCLHKLGSREEAEDAAQTTFLNAFRGIQRGVRPEIEQAWLFKIAENVCLTRHRSTFRRRRVETPSDFDAVQEVVPSPPRDGDTLIRLTDALAEMPEQQRRALLLREWQGLSYREIAEELGLSQPAVETLLFRARRTLAHGLTEAPQPKKKRARLRSGLDLGALLTAVKAAFAGGAAVKVAAVTAVAATTAVAGSKVENKIQHAHARQAHAVAAKPDRPAQAQTPAAAPALRQIAATASAAQESTARPAATKRSPAQLVLPGKVGRVDDKDLAPAPPAAVDATVAMAAASVAAPEPAPAPVAAEQPVQAAPEQPAAAPPVTTRSAERRHEGRRTDERKQEEKRTQRDLSATQSASAPASQQPDPGRRDRHDRQGGGKDGTNDQGTSVRTVDAAPSPTAVATTPPSGATGSGRGDRKNDKKERKGDAPAPDPGQASTTAETPPIVAPVPQEQRSDQGSGKGRGRGKRDAPAPAPATAPAEDTTAAQSAPSDPGNWDRNGRGKGRRK